MNAKLIRLYEEVKLKDFPFKDQPAEYGFFKIETSIARALHETRYESNKSGYSQTRKEEYLNLVNALYKFEAPHLLTHILGPGRKSIILFTDVDIDFLIGSLTSEYFLNI